MPQAAVAGPFGKADLCDQLRFDPSAEPHLRSTNTLTELAATFCRKIYEGALVPAQRLKLMEQRAQRGLVEAGAYFAGERQFVAFVITNQQGSEEISCAFWLGVAAH